MNIDEVRNEYEVSKEYLWQTPDDFDRPISYILSFLIFAVPISFLAILSFVLLSNPGKNGVSPIVILPIVGLIYAIVVMIKSYRNKKRDPFFDAVSTKGRKRLSVGITNEGIIIYDIESKKDDEDVYCYIPFSELEVKISLFGRRGVSKISFKQKSESKAVDIIMNYSLNEYDFYDLINELKNNSQLNSTIPKEVPRQNMLEKAMAPLFVTVILGSRHFFTFGRSILSGRGDVDIFEMIIYVIMISLLICISVLYYKKTKRIRNLYENWEKEKYKLRNVM